jgi:hypothetical protein
MAQSCSKRMARGLLAAALLASALLAAAGADAGAPLPPLGAGARAAFSGGRLAPGWSSWSWGLAAYGVEGSSLCATVEPWGALQLKAARPFAAAGAALRLSVRGDAAAPGAVGLELQLEGAAGADGARVASRVATLGELLAAQGSSAAALEAGEWVELRLPLAALQAEGAAAAPASYDRLAIGRCLSGDAPAPGAPPCEAAGPPTRVCLDLVALEAPAV